jgi:hypothetical protein
LGFPTPQDATTNGAATGTTQLYGGAAAAAAAAAAGRPPAKPVCKTVHAWVLVMPGKRDIQDPFFVEPTTVSRGGMQQLPCFLMLRHPMRVFAFHSAGWLKHQREVKERVG